MHAIRFNSISKTYHQNKGSQPVRALTDFNLEVDSGDVFVLAGLNGAGKTTAIKIIFGACRPDNGTCHILGKTRESLLPEDIGFAPESCELPLFLTPRELLKYSCKLLNYNYNNAEIDHCLKQLDLVEVEDRPLCELSKGTRQRASLAAAIIHKPKLLILDEPASGLDPVGRAKVKKILKDLNVNGTTIFFTTHILSDVAGFCSKIAIMHQGRIIYSSGGNDFVRESATHNSAEDYFRFLIDKAEK